MKTNRSILALAIATLAFSPLAFAQTTVVTGGTTVAGTAEVRTTTTAGTISEFSPDTIIVRSESAPEPIRYTYTKTTTYVDDAGEPVSLETVKSGLPVTVHYVREGDRVVANRVIVHRRKAVISDAPAVREERRVVTPAVEERRVVTPAPAPVIEERKTTTTTTVTGGKRDKDKDKDKD